MKQQKRIAIVGGGPSGLFMFKRLVDAGNADISVDIFERKKQLGAGMPYSIEGAADEHITNVSGNEIPELVTSLADWIKQVPSETLAHYKIDADRFNEYKVLPRLLFGQYLAAQFDLLLQKAQESGVESRIHFETEVTDIIDDPKNNTVIVKTAGTGSFEFDRLIICSGHLWPKKFETTVPGYFDSPYPPAKLALKINHPVAIKGSSLTAIDAVRTLARYNGSFVKSENGGLSYSIADDSAGFKLQMYSRNGMLPAIRFHLEDSHLSKESVMDKDEIRKVRDANSGFIPLDYVFEEYFKKQVKEKDGEFYAKVRDMRPEDFVEMAMDVRERVGAFNLFEAEYAEAAKSIKRRESVYWKEMLAVLSFAMNHPAKYFCGEDMQRLQKSLMPLISVVIAFVPQSSVEEMLALYHAGVLEIASVGKESSVEPQAAGGALYNFTNEEDIKQSVHYKTFVDCVGQPHLSYSDLPYPSLLSEKIVSHARLKFRDVEKAVEAQKNPANRITQDGPENFYLTVPGVAINDNFQLVDEYGAFNERIFMMAVPYIGGFNPDYSGLDFCEAASEEIMQALQSDQ